MSDEKAIAKYEYETDHGTVTLTPEIVAKYLVSGNGKITNGELAMFLNLCKYQKLNPFLREVYLIKYSDSEPATMVVGKDVHVKRASKHPQFDGIESGVIIFNEEKKLEERAGSFTLPGENIVGGWAIGHRKDWSTPRKITVSFEEYVARKKDGSPNRSWSKMPGTMIVKVAEAQCLRAMFPEELQALYNAEEMGHEPYTLPQAPLPTGGGESAHSLRRKIEQVIEDNRDVVEIGYAEAISEEIYATEDKVHIANVLDELHATIKSMRRKETGVRSQESFDKVAEERYKEKVLSEDATTAPDEPEPDIPDSKLEEQELF